MRLPQWMSRTPGTPARTDDVPRWVMGFQNVSRPAIAVIIMVMCAPGEHHLAVMAGWSQQLAWGMPSCLVFYTAVAAIVATKRAKGAPGKRTAVAGAVLALGLAMSAQPVSHMFVLGQWTGDPTPLVWIVSCVPPLVAGHLWHLAASPSQLSALVRDVKAMVPDRDGVPEPVSLSWDKPWDTAPASVPDVELPPVPAVPDSVPGRPDWLYDENGIRPEWRDHVPAVVPDSGDIGPDAMRWAPDPELKAEMDRVLALPVRSVRDRSVTSVALQVVRDNPGLGAADLADIVSNRLPDVKPDTVRKAVYRARRAA